MSRRDHSTRRARVPAALGVLVALLTGLVVLVSGATPAGASHYRATQITWQQISGNEVDFHATASWRCSFFFASPCDAVVGDTFSADSIDFGDGSFSGSTWTVTAVDVANDVISGELEEHHTYASTGPFTVSVETCCRLGSSNGHINNGDGSVRAETIVDLALSSANPVSSIAPIVDCPLDAVCSFVVPAFDPDGQPMRWRFSTAAEAGSGFFVQPGPPFATNAATINATTGLYSWDTTGAQLAATGSTFYSTQVMVENVVNDVVVTKTPVDFFIRLGSNSTNQAPVFQSPTPADGTVINGAVGVPVTFGVAASDADVADTVTLNILGMPSGASFTTAPANPASGSFSWTPPSTGTFILTLTAQDNQGLGATPRSVTIVVGTGTDPAPVVDAGPGGSGAEGSPIALDGTATDDGPITTTWSYVAGAGVDAGATCTFAAPGSVDTSITCTDDGSYTVTLTADDGVNPPQADTATVTVTNANPSVSISSPADMATFPVGGSVNVSAPFSDAGSNDDHSCTIDWGDSSADSVTDPATTPCTGTHAYAAIGVYTITVTVTDDDGGQGSASIGVVVFDRATKVTGGGFVLNPRRSFGFVARQAADGALSGQIQVRDHNVNRFHGNVVTSLSVSGSTATWSGTGRWNGVDGYAFTASVVDNGNGGGRNRVRDTIQVTITAPGGAVVLSFSGSLQGGNIVVHR